LLAVSRAGKSYFDPDADFRLFPGDRLVLLGEKENVERAASFFKRQSPNEEEDELGEFMIASLEVPSNAAWPGRAISELNFRNEFGVTIIGIRRGETQITAPSPREIILAGDFLIVAGNKNAVELLNSRLATM
jgi:monovalent cation:H+ antiporter-2, CPA2 family